MLFQLSLKTITITAFTSSLIVISPIIASAIPADTNIQQQTNISTSAADLGGKVELDCGTIISLLKHSESCSVGGAYLAPDNLTETIPLENKPLIERLDDDKLILLEIPL